MISRPVLLTVRGTPRAQSLDEVRTLHNATAGSPAGIAAARALGDLSHRVFAPVDVPLSSAKAGEILFLDVWESPQGIMDFFADPQVAASGQKLFAEREPAVWMPATGAYTVHFPPSRAKADPYVAMLRGPVASAEGAVDVFASSVAKAQREARRRGRLAHDLYVKLSPPGHGGPVEILAIDIWTDLAGMAEHYREDTHMAAIRQVFTGPPQPMIWESAAGNWSEW